MIWYYIILYYIILYFIIVYYSIYAIYIEGVLYICLYTLYNNVSICSCTPIHAYWYVYTWTFAYLIVQVHEGENEITEWKTRYGPRAFCIILKRHPSLYVLYMYVWLCVMTFIHNHARKSVLHDHWVFFGTIGHCSSHLLLVKDWLTPFTSSFRLAHSDFFYGMRLVEPPWFRHFGRLD